MPLITQRTSYSKFWGKQKSPSAPLLSKLQVGSLEIYYNHLSCCGMLLVNGIFTEHIEIAYHLFGLAPPFTHSFQPGSSSTPHVYWPCRSGQVAPNVGLEVRTSARWTSIEKRFVATPSFSSLMKSPCVLKMTILVIFLLFRGSHGGFQSPDPVALSRALFGSPCDCGGGTFTVRPATYTQEVDCGEKTAYLAYRHSITASPNPSGNA
ncbi:uncharacterized protein LOC144456397 [Phascolarctos cinereus]